MGTRRKAASKVPKGAPDVVTIKEAAALLGVSEATLRRCDRVGKFSSHRHQVNNYRVYRRGDALHLRDRIENGEAA